MVTEVRNGRIVSQINGKMLQIDQKVSQRVKNVLQMGKIMSHRVELSATYTKIYVRRRDEGHSLSLKDTFSILCDTISTLFDTISPICNIFFTPHDIF